MVSEGIVTLLQTIGFIRDRHSLVDSWTFREEALTFRAQAVWARDGIQLNASMRTDQEWYESDGRLSESPMRMK